MFTSFMKFLFVLFQSVRKLKAKGEQPTMRYPFYFPCYSYIV